MKEPATRKVPAKAAAVQSAPFVVRDAKTGRFVTVKGAGALKGSPFAIKKGVDLTKPIAKQALKTSLRNSKTRKGKA